MNKVWVVGIFCMFFSSVSSAATNDTEATSFVDALENGYVRINARLRYEDVNQGVQGAQALTLRSRLSYETKSYQFYSAFVELDNVAAIPRDDNYNSGSNGQLDDVLVQDPEGTELNRVWLAYDVSNTLIKFGRQKIHLNNERLLGADSFRQNEQTFSGVSILNETMDLTRITFAQINSVQGISGDDNVRGNSEIDAKLFNVEYRGFYASKLSLYSLWLIRHRFQPQWESNTYGIRFSGETGDDDFSIDYAFEYAQQEDAGHNALNYKANYSLTELDFGFHTLNLKLGQEVLGADDNAFFVTPLSSLHRFQGATDQFQNQGLGNVLGGVQDSYASLSFSKSEQFTLSASYHDFQSDDRSIGPGSLGQEWGVSIETELDNYRFFTQYADYNRKHFGASTRRLWFSAELSF